MVQSVLQLLVLQQVEGGDQPLPQSPHLLSFHVLNCFTLPSAATIIPYPQASRRLDVQQEEHNPHSWQGAQHLNLSPSCLRVTDPADKR